MGNVVNYECEGDVKHRRVAIRQVLEYAGSGHDLGAPMTTDPTQPMSPPASAGSGSPELPEPQQPGLAEESAPTVQEARPSFPQAQPSFQPAQPGFQPSPPAFEPP